MLLSGFLHKKGEKNIVVQQQREEKEVQSAAVVVEEEVGVLHVERGSVKSTHSDVWTLYVYAMKSPVTREKYQVRFGKFLNFVLGLDGAAGEIGKTTTQQKANVFAQKGREDTNWAFDIILKFIQFQLDRVNNKEITGGTVRNYVKSIKLFCDMADIHISWKKITRGLPRGRRYANDRIPTLEEIRKLVDYPLMIEDRTNEPKRWWTSAKNGTVP
jgi:hypothetical protein